MHRRVKDSMVKPVLLNFVSMEWFENDGFWRAFYPFMFSDERFAATPDEVTRILALTQFSGGSVLDLCCGPGRHSVELAYAASRSQALIGLHFCW